MSRWLSTVFACALACVAANCASFQDEEEVPVPERKVDDTCVLDSPNARLDECKLAP